MWIIIMLIILFSIIKFWDSNYLFTGRNSSKKKINLEIILQLIRKY